MKATKLPLYLISGFLTLLACTAIEGYSQVNTWQGRQSFGGTPRSLVAGFTIGTKAYIGTGYDGNATKDFWAYDPTTDTWAQIADFGGGTRNGAVGFSIGNKGYVGTGSTNEGLDETKDFWEYNPATNAWTRKADFGGPARLVAIGLSIGNKGYIGPGRTANVALFKDFWEYDPLVDTWTRKADFGGTPRYATSGFSIGTKGYIGTGTDYSWDNIYRNDFWEYDQTADTWTRKADFGGGHRELAVGFSIGNKGYVGTGLYNTDFWEYDNILDVWTRKADFLGGERDQAYGFSVGGKGYICTGRSYNGLGNDLWVYTSETPTISCSNNNSILYYGYSGDQTVTVTGTPTGGTGPYSVSITMDRPLKCNVITSSGNEIWIGGAGTSTNTNTICPTAGISPISVANSVAQGGSYSVNATLMADAVFTVTVTDASGNSSTCTTKVHAEDARCFAGNSSNQKITLCHKTGNIKNPCVTMCVDQSAVQEHLDHGDFLGKCTGNCVALVNARTQGQIVTEVPKVTGLTIKVLPNPSSNRFTLRVESDNINDKLKLRVVDILGRVVEVKTNIFAGQTLQIGNNYIPGIYLLEVIQGSKRKTIKLIKQSD